MKRILTAIMAAFMLLIILPTKVNAEENIQYNINNVFKNDEFSNVKYIDNDISDGKIIYELTNSGETYRVTEYIEDNYKKVTSYIEIKQLDNSYKTIIKNISVLTEDSINICSYDYITTELNNSKYEIKHNEIEKNYNLESINVSLLRNSTGWVYDGTITGSNKIFKLTLSIIVQIIIGIAAPGGVVVSAITSTIAGNIAAYIIDNNIKTIYYEQDYYEKRSLDVPWPMVTGSKWVTRYYADSDRTKYINTITEIVDQS